MSSLKPQGNTSLNVVSEGVPESDAVRSPGILSRIFFLFVAPTIARARKTQGAGLDVAEMPSFLRRDVNSSKLCDLFERDWEQEQKKAFKEKPEKVHILWSVARSQKSRLLFTALLYIISQGSTLAGPLILKEIVSGLACFQIRAEAPEGTVECRSRTILYYWACGLFVAPLIQAFAENTMTFELNKAGLAMRNALMAAIFNKCLRLNTVSLAQASTGKIVTLMSNDAQKIQYLSCEGDTQDAALAIHTLWGSPLFIIAVMVLLYLQIQWACFVGLVVMFLLGPITMTVGKRLGLLRRSIIQWTDKRTGIMNELINGMRVVKFYAWERPFVQIASKYRSQEATILWKIAKLQGVFGMVLFSGPVFVALASFTAYALAGNTLTAPDAFAALALFTLLRFPMSFLPIFLQSAVNANVALKRIREFLQLPEVSDDDPRYLRAGVEPGRVEIRGASFVWDAADGAEPVLRDVNLTCAPGTLTMIVGAVGSGKSSLLAALIRHITCTEGTVAVGGRVAFASQSAWILNETIRENILMGEPMDEKRYKMALKSSQLLSDLKLLADYDLTEIGERGVTLSGGQKQRVSIARAVYADADVVILDDPLSAVDAHVGKALFEKCLRGALKDKTVILVTNALHFVHNADQLVWLYGGEVRQAGTYEEVSGDKMFAEMVGNHVVSEETVEKDPAAVTAGSALSSKQLLLVDQQEKNLTGNEEKSSGALAWPVMKAYIVAGGSWKWVIPVFIAYTLEQGARATTDRWIGFWTQDQFDQSLAFYLLIYGALACAFAFITYLRALTFALGTVRATLKLHNALLYHLMKLPMSFFDTNPSGRVINRFSRDTDIMDSTLPQSLLQLGACVSTFFATLIVISIATPIFAALIPGIAIGYFVMQRYYIPAARDLQRLEAVTRSPIYTGFSEAISGISTIRAYNKASLFSGQSHNRIQTNALVFLTQRAAAAWLSIRLDFIGLLVLTCAGLLAVRGSIDPGLAGLSLTYALDLTKFLKFGTQMASKVESDFNSVERIYQYLEEDPEAPLDREDDPEEGSWPSKGAIVVENVKMRYRADTPLVLHGVNFTLNPSEKVGVVGRTGSGKSSLFLVFFRMVELAAGRIVIDGVDIASLGLKTLRSQLSMIPQDPFMFSGTVRNNLDPFEQYEDGKVWSALDGVGLGKTIRGFDDKLDASVSDNGSNFSLGQRQLFCLARALLRNSKILFLDEATASVDMDTDLLIQHTVRTSFKHCTVLTIAHRLNTIMDADRVLVMDAGCAAEYDTPVKLLEDPGSLFSSLVQNTGKKSAAHLHNVATNAARARSSGGGLPQELEVAQTSGTSEASTSGGGTGASPPGTSTLLESGDDDDASRSPSPGVDSSNPVLPMPSSLPGAGFVAESSGVAAQATHAPLTRAPLDANQQEGSAAAVAAPAVAVGAEDRGADAVAAVPEIATVPEDQGPAAIVEAEVAAEVAVAEVDLVAGHLVAGHRHSPSAEGEEVEVSLSTLSTPRFSPAPTAPSSQTAPPHWDNIHVNQTPSSQDSPARGGAAGDA